MRPRRTVVLALVLVTTLLLAGCLSGGGGPHLEAEWNGDTERNVSGNHHAVAAGTVDGEGYVFAPVSGEHRSPHCALVGLHAGNGSTAWSDGVDPAVCTSHSVADPTLADFDADGTPEVLAATTERAVIAHAPRTGDAEWRHDLTAYGYSRAVVADLASPDGPEVAVADAGGGLFVANPEAGTVWSRSLDARVWATPAVADFDADDAPELVVGHGAGGFVAFERDGVVAWRLDDAAEGAVTWLTAGQVDDDAAVEVVAATTEGTVLAVDGRDGEVTWQRDLGPLAAVRALGGGDDPAVYAAVSDGTLRRLSGSNGSVEWTTTLTNASVQVAPPPASGDVDGDGTPELVAATNDGVVSVVDPDSGDVLATYSRDGGDGADVPIFTHPTVADADGDGTAEIYVIYGDGRVTRLAYSNG